MDLETVETERLFLKKLTPKSFVYLFNNHSEDEIIRLLGLSGHAAYVREKEKSKGGYKTYDRTIAAFLIILKSSGQTIGRCGFHNWYSIHRKAEIGYVIYDEENRRKGYMNEAIKCILDYGFNIMNLNRIEAYTSPENKASLHIIEKYGFTREGYLRQHFFWEGEVLDTLLFALLKEEYDKKEYNNAGN
jgi:[ribosomal protein S5]-alanine N-acetyltransferase